MGKLWDKLKNIGRSKTPTPIAPATPEVPVVITPIDPVIPSNDGFWSRRTPTEKKLIYVGGACLAIVGGAVALDYFSNNNKNNQITAQSGQTQLVDNSQTAPKITQVTPQNQNSAYDDKIKKLEDELQREKSERSVRDSKMQDLEKSLSDSSDRIKRYESSRAPAGITKRMSDNKFNTLYENGMLYFSGDKGIDTFNFEASGITKLLSGGRIPSTPQKWNDNEEKFKQGIEEKGTDYAYRAMLLKDSEGHPVFVLLDTKNNKEIGKTAVIGGSVYDFSLAVEKNVNGRKVPTITAILGDFSLGWANDEAQHKILGKDFETFTTNQRLYSEGKGEIVNGKRMPSKQEILELVLFQGEGDGIIGADATKKLGFKDTSGNKELVRLGQQTWFDHEFKPLLTYTDNLGVQTTLENKPAEVVYLSPASYSDIRIKSAKIVNGQVLSYEIEGDRKFQGAVIGADKIINQKPFKTLEEKIK